GASDQLRDHRFFGVSFTANWSNTPRVTIPPGAAEATGAAQYPAAARAVFPSVWISARSTYPSHTDNLPILFSACSSDKKRTKSRKLRPSRSTDQGHDPKNASALSMGRG